MPGIIIKTKTDTRLVKQSLQNLGKEIPRIGKNQIYQVMMRSQKILKRPGEKPTYPIKWDSIKQKIKVIIILRHVFGRMPYKRTKGYQRGFSVKPTKTGYELVNATERAVYISGDAVGKGQSRIHKGRYPIMRKVVNAEFRKLPKAVVKHIEIVAKQQGLETGV